MKDNHFLCNIHAYYLSHSITGPPEQSAMAKYEIEMIAAGTPVKTTSNPAAQAAATAAMYATPGVYNPFGAAAGGAYSAYGLDAATVLAYSAYYGQAAASTAAGYYDPATLQQYAALQAAAAAGVTATTGKVELLGIALLISSLTSFYGLSRASNRGSTD